MLVPRPSNPLWAEQSLCHSWGGLHRDQHTWVPVPRSVWAQQRQPAALIQLPRLTWTLAITFGNCRLPLWRDAMQAHLTPCHLVQPLASTSSSLPCFPSRPGGAVACTYTNWSLQRDPTPHTNPPRQSSPQRRPATRSPACGPAATAAPASDGQTRLRSRHNKDNGAQGHNRPSVATSPAR